jgi:hypothetical protein
MGLPSAPVMDGSTAWLWQEGLDRRGLGSCRLHRRGFRVGQLDNPYEAPGCQESNGSRQRMFAFFPALLMLAALAIGRVS